MSTNQRKIGIILSYVSEAVQILSGLVYTPIMIKLLGSSEYGLYQLVYSVVSYLGLLSLGFGASYIRFYSKYKTKNDEAGIARLNGMFIIVFSIISVICICCGVVMVSNVKTIFDKGLTDAEYATARILMGLMVVNLAMTFPNAVFECNITANEKFLFQKLLMVAKNILNPFLALPLLIMGYGSIGMVVVVTVLTFSVLISNIVFCFTKLHIKFLFTNLKFSLFKEMWVFTFFIFLNQIIDQVNWSVDKFLLGRMSGTAAVAIYGVGGQINSMYLQFSTGISNVFVPKVNKIVAESDDNYELTVLFTKIGRIQFMIMALILSGFTFFGEAFIGLWTGKTYQSAYYVTLILIYPVTIPLIQNLGIEIQRAKNMHKARSVVYFFIAVGNVILSIPLIGRFGPSGAAMGTAISLILGNILFMNWYYHKRIQLDMLYFWRNIGMLIPSLIVPFILGILLMRYINITSWMRLGLVVFIYTITYCSSLLVLGINEYEKNIICGLYKKISRKCVAIKS